jgi:hypothetical protein
MARREPGALYLTATYVWSQPDLPQTIEASLVASTEPTETYKADAAAWLAARPAPKSLGLKATGLTTPEYSADGRYRTVPFIRWQANLTGDGVNGGVNETGLRRYRRLLAWAAEHGVPVVWAPIYANAYASQADLEAAIG